MTDERAVSGGGWLAGAPVGVICLRTSHALLPGNVQHAASFAAPVLYAAIDAPAGCSLPRGDPEFLPLIIEAGHSLLSQGVAAIAGACGSFAHYQREVAAALPAPVFMSIMVQAPFILAGLAPRKKLCVIAAWASALTPNVFAQCGVRDAERLVIREMVGRPAFDAMFKPGGVARRDALASDVCAVAEAALRDEPEIGAFLLQCSDLPPCAPDLVAATGLPVFDMAGLIRWLQAAFMPPSINGYTRYVKASDAG